MAKFLYPNLRNAKFGFTVDRATRRTFATKKQAVEAAVMHVIGLNNQYGQLLEGKPLDRQAKIIFGGEFNTEGLV